MSEEQEKTKSYQDNDWFKREIGALWKKQNPQQSFYTGRITLNDQEVEIVCFTNKKKTKDTHPDIRIYLSQDRQQ